MAKSYYYRPKYRVILTFNGKYKKTLYGCMTRETVFTHFHKIKDNNKVLYPKRIINSNKLTPVKYEICVIKVTEYGDEQRILRDDYGKLYTEPFLGDWTIIDSAPYEIEETFYIWGMSHKAKYRPDIREVVKRLLVNSHTKKNNKQVIVVHNKLIIYNELQFDMIICKNLQEAQRLHHTLAKIAKKQGVKSILFMGTASKVMVSVLYDLIHQKTNWAYTKIRRRATCR